MEYAKDIILNLGSRRLNRVKRKINFTKIKNSRLKNGVSIIMNILKKWINSVINVIKNNKLICSVISLLIFFIAIDFILIDNFIKLFSTLY